MSLSQKLIHRVPLKSEAPSAPFLVLSTPYEGTDICSTYGEITIPHDLWTVSRASEGRVWAAGSLFIN